MFMLKASKASVVMYFRDASECAKFLSAQGRAKVIPKRVRECICMNKQDPVFTYQETISFFAHKLPGEFSVAGWIIEECDISEEEATLLNAVSGA